MAVFVLDKQKRPLMPCSEKRARLLLARGRAVVVRLAPFTIRLKDRVGGETQPLRVKIDPGSRVTGLAVVRETETPEPDTDAPRCHTEVLWLAELTHRGAAISASLKTRRNFRRGRRWRNLRYRPARFDNRARPKGWLTPTLRHRVESVCNWVERLRRLAPISAISQELVRFDTQALETPEIRGVEYQQGTLFGYEVREYLLEKWGRQCAYCDATKRPLQIEHIVPRARGGSSRIHNLTLACQPCNRRKGARPIEDFLARKPERLARILAQAKRPLKDAAAVNATRWALWTALAATGLPVACASGGRTKWNRSRFGVPKTHALDAACVGRVDALAGWNRPVLAIKASGRGSYSRTRAFSNGFPRGYLIRTKQVAGFQTGDWVQAVVPQGKKAGTHRGRVAVRKSGSFNIQTATRLVEGVNRRYCRVLQRADGYGYSFHPKPTEVASRAA